MDSLECCHTLSNILDRKRADAKMIGPRGGGRGKTFGSANATYQGLPPLAIDERPVGA